MYRRTLRAAAAASRRTIVRDPRQAANSAPAVRGEADATPQQQQQQRRQPCAVQDQRPPLPMQQPPPPFAPSLGNQESLGSSLASYALAGVGVALGVTLVRVVLGF